MEKFLKENVDKLLQINIEINSFLKAEKLDSNINEEEFAAFQAKIEPLLAEKDSIIEILKELKKKSGQDFSAVKESDEWTNIEKLEAENLETMKKAQKLFLEGAVGAKVQSKAISSYKFNKEIKPRLFDDSL